MTDYFDGLDSDVVVGFVQKVGNLVDGMHVLAVLDEETKNQNLIAVCHRDYQRLALSAETSCMAFFSKAAGSEMNLPGFGCVPTALLDEGWGIEKMEACEDIPTFVSSVETIFAYPKETLS